MRGCVYHFFTAVDRALRAPPTFFSFSLAVSAVLSSSFRLSTMALRLTVRLGEARTPISTSVEAALESRSMSLRRTGGGVDRRVPALDSGKVTASAASPKLGKHSLSFVSTVSEGEANGASTRRRGAPARLVQNSSRSSWRSWSVNEMHVRVD